MDIVEGTKTPEQQTMWEQAIKELGLDKLEAALKSKKVQK